MSWSVNVFVMLAVWPSSKSSIRAMRAGAMASAHAGHDEEVVEDPAIGVHVGLAVGREEHRGDVRDARRVRRGEGAEPLAPPGFQIQPVDGRGSLAEVADVC